MPGLSETSRSVSLPKLQTLHCSLQPSAGFRSVKACSNVRQEPRSALAYQYVGSGGLAAALSGVSYSLLHSISWLGNQEMSR